MKIQKGASVLRYYSNSLADALLDLYPDLELNSVAFAQMHSIFVFLFLFYSFYG